MGSYLRPKDSNAIKVRLFAADMNSRYSHDTKYITFKRPINSLVLLD